MFPALVFVPFRHCAQKWEEKKLPESHLSVTCERRADEPLDREEGKVANEEGCAFNRDALPVASRQRKNSGAFQAPLASVNHSHGAFWQILNIHDDELLGCHRSENSK